MKFNNQNDTKKGVLIGLSVLGVILLFTLIFFITSKFKLSKDSEKLKTDTKIEEVVDKEYDIEHHNLIKLDEQTNIAVDITFKGDMYPYIEFLTPNEELVGEWIEGSREVPYEMYGNTLTYFLNNAIVGQWKIGYEKGLDLEINCREYNNDLSLSELNYLRIIDNQLVISYITSFTSGQHGMFDIKISAVPAFGDGERVLLSEGIGELGALSTEYLMIDKLKPNSSYKLLVETSPLDEDNWTQEMSIWDFTTPEK